MPQAPAERIGLLGSEPETEKPQPSAVVVSDGFPLLFPVRSLTGLFAWVTSVEVLSRFQRDVASYGVKITALPHPPRWVRGRREWLPRPCSSGASKHWSWKS